MRNETQTGSCVESIDLVEHLENRVALASVRVRDVHINGVAVWRSGSGKLCVFFPSYKRSAGWRDAKSQRTSALIEADVIAAYKDAKAAQPK
jgi:hypothetical protein